MKAARFISFAAGIVFAGAVSWQLLHGPTALQPEATTAPTQTASGSSCGPTALLTVAAIYDANSAAKLQKVLDRDQAASRPVTSFHDLAAWAREADLDLIGLKVEPKEALRLPLPMIVHLKPGHFVALTGISGDRVVITDQEHGQIEISSDEFRRRFSGFVLCLRN